MKIASVVLGIVFIVFSPICFYHYWTITATYSIYGGLFYVYVLPFLIFINGLLFITKSQHIPHAIAINLFACVTFIAQELFNTLYHLIRFWHSQELSVSKIIIHSLEHVFLFHKHSLFLPSVALFVLLVLFRPSRVKALSE